MKKQKKYQVQIFGLLVILFFVHAMLKILKVIVKELNFLLQVKVKEIQRQKLKHSDKIRDQQDLFEKRECIFKEEVTRLKAQLEEGNKVRNQYKAKEGQCKRLQDEVMSLKNKVNDKDKKIKKLKDKSSYYETLQAEVIFLKEDLEN